MKVMPKVPFKEVYLHKETNIYLRLNRDQTAQW